MRSYLAGERTAGVRRTAEDRFLAFTQYCRQRLHEDPHLQATVLFDEVVGLGYAGGYSTFTRALKRHRLRPPCSCCERGAREAVRADEEEVRFDWLSFPSPPAAWGFGSHAHVLMATVARTGRWRAVLTEDDTFPILVEATDQVLRRLGIPGSRWRFDRIPAVRCTATNRVSRAFSQVAKYYGVTIDCRPRRDRRYGPEDEGLRPIADFWWRMVSGNPDVNSAQRSLDQLAAWMDGLHAQNRGSHGPGGEAAGPAGSSSLPRTPFPAWVCGIRAVTYQSLVPFRGNSYAVPPGLVGAMVEVRWRIDQPCLAITTARGAVIARHELAPRGAGRVVTGPGPGITLERPERISHRRVATRSHEIEEYREHPSSEWDELDPSSGPELERGRPAAPRDRFS